FFIGLQINAQSIVVGADTGTTTSTGNDPIDGYYEAFRYQVVYTASELSASMTPYDEITALGFSIAADYAGGDLLGYTIKMGHTAATDAATHSNLATTVVKSPFNYNPTVTAVGAFDMIVFDTPFVWNGVDNVIIEICSDGPNAYTAPYGEVRVTASVANGSRFYRVDGGTACGVNTSTTNANRPVIQFDYVDGTPPSCLAPSAGTASSVTTMSASLGWTPGAGESLWNIEWGVSGFTQGTGTVVNGVTNPHPLNGLSDATTYQFYVQADCGGSGLSTWSGPYSFTTPCNAADVPYTQDFESATTPAAPLCNLIVNEGTGNNWATTTVTDSYGFNGKILRYTYNGSNPANSWFFTQGVNLTAGTSYRVSYVYGGTGFYAEKMKVAYGTSASAAAMTIPLADYPNIMEDTATNAFVDFTPAASGVYYFGFNAYSDADMFYLNLDNIVVDLSPSCFAPTALNATVLSSDSVSLSWTAGAGESLWNIEYGPSGFTQGTGTVESGVSNPYVLNGLAAATEYEYYVQADCGAGDTSVWVGPFLFDTTQTPGCTTVISPADGAIDVPAGTIVFSWDAPTTGDPAVSYNMYYGTTPGDVTNLVGNFLTTSANIDVTDFNTTFYWTIQAVNAGGEATGCAIWSFTTGAAPGYCLSAVNGQWPGTTYTPATCDGVTVNNVTTNGWAGEYSLVNVTAGETYKFESSNATDFITISSDGGVTPDAYGTTPVLWTSTVTGPIRFYTHLDDQCTSEDVSRTRSVTCGGALSAASFDADSFEAYPNPVKNVLNLAYTTEIASVAVYNLVGQEVMSKNLNAAQSQLDMSNLSAGTYVVKVNVDGLVKTIKVVKE
ncbi:fibronectin type III domain-containing protein, partial [Flavobacterium saliperosum]